MIKGQLKCTYGTKNRLFLVLICVFLCVCVCGCSDIRQESQTIFKQNVYYIRNTCMNRIVQDNKNMDITNV